MSRTVSDPCSRRREVGTRCTAGVGPMYLVPRHLGTLNFDGNAVDDLLRRPEHGDGSTTGILLAADRDDVVVEYALRGFETRWW